jgi:hypothetical protein
MVVCDLLSIIPQDLRQGARAQLGKLKKASGIS